MKGSSDQRAMKGQTLLDVLTLHADHRGALLAPRWAHKAFYFLVLFFVVLLPGLASPATGQTAEECSPLPCEQILVQLPYELEWGSEQDHGKIPDANGRGTGFTYVDQPTNGT